MIIEVPVVSPGSITVAKQALLNALKYDTVDSPLSFVVTTVDPATKR